MRETKKTKPNLAVFRSKWAVAELEVSYKPAARTGTFVTSGDDAYKVFMKMWDQSLISIQEQVCALFLSNQNEVIGFRLISTGQAIKTLVDIPFICSLALICRARAVVIAHNHPSGIVVPSDADMEVTETTKNALKQIGVDMYDHLVIAPDTWMSCVSYANILDTINKRTDEAQKRKRA